MSRQVKSRVVQVASTSGFTSHREGDSHSTLKAVKNLLRWARKRGRSFPWRAERDPYAILVAEKLLQQTAAREVVIRAYKEVIQTFPTPFQLADADVEVLADIIRPLGFSYRARELKALGQALVLEYHGNIPCDLKQLKALPGVGDYAARAILSFAFDEDVPVVDTNVARFLYRFFGIQGPLPANPARKKILIELAGSLVPRGRSKAFNLALLDLCAEICISRQPLCNLCPMRQACAWSLQMVPSKIPGPILKKRQCESQSAKSD
jgi:A/G-specific adenine glycosylase